MINKIWLRLLIASVVSVSALLSNSAHALPNACRDLFDETRISLAAPARQVRLDLLTSAETLKIVGAVERVFSYDEHEFEGLRGHFEKVAAEQSKNVGIDRYWVAKDAQGKILGGAGLYFAELNGMRGFWVDWFFVEPTARGMRLGDTLMNKIVERAKELNLDQVRLYTSDRAEEAAANKLYAKYGFELTRAEPELNPDGSIRYDKTTGLHVTRLYRSKQIVADENVPRTSDYMPGGEFRGEPLDTRFRSMRLMTKLDSTSRNLDTLVAFVNHYTGFYTAKFKTGSVSRVILQNVAPKGGSGAGLYSHIRMRFDFSEPVQLLNPQTGEVVDQTHSLTINIGTHARQADRDAGKREVKKDDTLALFYSLITLEKAAEKMIRGNERGRDIEQFEFQVDAELRERILVAALNHGNELGSNVMYDGYKSNCSTQLFDILKDALDGVTPNAAFKQRITKNYQNEARLFPKIVGKRFWPGIVKQVDLFQDDALVSEFRQRLGVEK